ncbi:MAG TPA: carboxypeptidase-like regulatory domain-containing protein, partial [Bacteroidota bacterium]
MAALLVAAAGGGFLFPPHALAQVTTAEIDGRIVDQKGAPVEDIEVVARNQETGNYQVTHSESNGKYHFHLLTPGRYELIAQHVNYNRAVKDNIRLNVGQTTVVN